MTRTKTRIAFTLVEMVMVIVIVGLLAAVVTPQFVDVRGDARFAAEIGTASRVRSGIKLARLTNLSRGQEAFPDALDDAQKGPGGDDNPLFNTVIASGVPDERWEKIGQRQYRYTPTGNTYKYDPKTGYFGTGTPPGSGGTDGQGGGGGVVFSDTLREGQGDYWMVTRGQWSWDDGGMSNAKSGENRAFAEALNGMDEYQVGLTANLDQGNGWGVWLGAGLDDRGRVSGYTFQYDPGWRGGAYLLREWSNDRESVIAEVRTDDLDYGTSHDFTLDVTGDRFVAYQDGEAVLDYEGDLSPAGDLVGLRTWSNTEAQFQDFTISERQAK